MMNKFLRILLIADSLKVFSVAMLGPIYAIYVNDIGGGVLAASWSVALMSLSSGITMYLAGKKADKMKNKKVAISLSYLLLALSYIGYMLVTNVYSLLIVQVYAGIAVAIGTPAFDGLYSQKLDKNKESSEWGNWEIMAEFVSFFGALIGGLLVVYLGFNALFIFMAILTLFASIVSYKYL